MNRNEIVLKNQIIMNNNRLLSIPLNGNDRAPCCSSSATSTLNLMSSNPATSNSIAGQRAENEAGTCESNSVI